MNCPSPIYGYQYVYTGEENISPYMEKNRGKSLGPITENAERVVLVHINHTFVVDSLCHQGHLQIHFPMADGS